MPKNITRVKWTASELPSGLSFDEYTGTFSGTAAEAGEYTVPVTVETNYGTDTKDVTFQVGSKGYKVYAIGVDAAEWSSGGIADEYGLYPIEIPKVSKLKPTYGGFIAETIDGENYYIGTYGISGYRRYMSPEKMPDDMAVKRGQFAAMYSSNSGRTLNNIKAGFYAQLSSHFYERTQKDALHFSSSQAEGYYVKGTSGGKPTYGYDLSSKVYEGFIEQSPSGAELADTVFIFGSYEEGISYLSDGGLRLNRIIFNQPSGTTSETKYSISSIELGYRAKKLFNSSVFECLSEDKYLDNDPLKFPYGEIEDAWFQGEAGYVSTVDGKLYEYLNGEFKLLGEFDVKKLEIPYPNPESYTGTAILLTRGGKLYHKGGEMSGITSEHDAFTEILSGVKAEDMTLSYWLGYKYWSGQMTTILDKNETSDSTTLVILKDE